MSPHEIACANVLRGVTFVPATPQKRFAREMVWRADHARQTPLTEAQSMWLSALVWKHRRQITDKVLVAACAIRTHGASYGPDAGLDERRRQLAHGAPGHIPVPPAEPTE